MGRNKGVNKGINPKVNVMARLEIELTYFDSAVQHVHLGHLELFLLANAFLLQKLIIWFLY